MEVVDCLRRRGGMAGAYHAPLAGSLFIAEVLFGTLMLASLGPVVVSAVVALLTTNLLSGAMRCCIPFTCLGNYILWNTL
jgi:H+/Cl- antiporter ClcA